MSADTRVKKRKSVEGEGVPSLKKAKMAKSAEKPAPLKSALKIRQALVDADAADGKVNLEGEADKGSNGAVVTKAKKGGKTASKVKASKRDRAAKTPDALTTKPLKSKVDAQKPVSSNTSAETVQAIEDLDDEDATAGRELTKDQTAALLAGFSSSEEEDDADGADDGIAISQLPKAPRASGAQTQSSEGAGEDPEDTPGVVYVGRIPHGFYERQMRAYFGQFGEVTNLRLARNRKTGKSQHYAFIEFAAASVAEIVAKTMDKYLMFGHILQVRMVPREQMRENVWRGSGKRLKIMPRNKIERGSLRRGMVREGWTKRIDKENRRRAAKEEQLKEIGYEFPIPTVKAVDGVPRKLADAPQASPEDVKEPVEEPQLLEDKKNDSPAVAGESGAVDPNKANVGETTKSKKRAKAERVKKVKKAKRVKVGA